tara:strand:- start:688 stop:951 length:264 start_codon:yes stop_codon:yes gene_type:complete
MRKLIIPLLAALALPTAVNAGNYYLYHGAWIQNVGFNRDRAELDGSIQVHSNIFNSLESCESAGKKLQEEIFEKVEVFKSEWSCVKK